MRRTETHYMYKVCKYRKEDQEWRVTYSPSSLELKCSCMRLESFGIPCEHLIAVMFKLDIINLPDTVIYERWTKCAKNYAVITTLSNEGNIDPTLVGKYMGFMHHCHSLALSAFKCGVPQHVRDTINILAHRTKFLDSVCSGDETAAMDADPVSIGQVRNPKRVRTKGCRVTSYSAPNRGYSQRNVRRAHCCRVCGARGHNRESCPVQRHMTFSARLRRLLVGHNLTIMSP